MTIEILSRQLSGTCSLTGKCDVEVWGVRAGGGETQLVSTQRLTEVLRVLIGVGIVIPAQSESVNRAKASS